MKDGTSSEPSNAASELLKVRQENDWLRKQLNQSVSLKQQSLQLSHRLDQVLMRFGAMQTFIHKSVGAETMQEFLPIVCESIIDLLECGVAIYWCLNEEFTHQQRFFQAGLSHVSEEDLAALDKWATDWVRNRDTEAPGSHAFPLRDTFGLAERLLLELIVDSNGEGLAIIISGNTPRQNQFQLEGNDSVETVFKTFAKQVGAMILSIKRKQIINLQIETIRTSEERLMTALASSNVGLWDWDVSLDHVHYSDEWKSQLGYSEDEIGNFTDEWITRLHPNDREYATQVAETCAQTPDGRFDLTVRMRHKSRRWVWINTRGYNLSNMEGGVRRVIGTHIDVTAFKAMEVRLIRAERKQRRARELAERENLAKSSFLAAVSHEIRTPLNGILGIFQMLGMREDLEREQMSKLIQMGESSGMWMYKIIGESLDIARIEAGKVEIVPEDVDLHSLLNEVRSQKLKRAAELDLEFRFKVADDVPRWVRVDPSRLRQILVNLLNNAIKFTREGFVSLEVKSGRIGKNGHRRVHFEITDSGIGISPKLQQVIFQPFTQGVDKSQSSEHGIGLGLMITKELVILMGGKIGFSSTRTQGTCFKVELPMEQIFIEPRTSQIDLNSKPKRFSGYILVVDDDDISGEIAKLILSELGVSVDIAKNGQIGLEMAEARRYDLILMDCWMPIMGGIEATVKLRSSSSALSRDSPVLALTANARSSDATACLQAGMNDFITKPLLVDHLIQLLTQYLPQTSIESPNAGDSDPKHAMLASENEAFPWLEEIPRVIPIP